MDAKRLLVGARLISSLDDAEVVAIIKELDPYDGIGFIPE